MKIYGISGLGADKRVFDYLILNAEFIPIDWIEPLKNEPLKNEPLAQYAKRLSAVIHTEEPFCILGVSFGGLVAIEISKLLSPKVTILISSAETKHELRPIYRWFGKIGLIHLLPTKMFDPPRKIAHFLFGTKNTQLLNDILDDTDLVFAKWAVQQLITWTNETRISNILKIVGTKDKLLPPKKTSKANRIEGGTHFMIVDRAKEISGIINKELSKI